MSGRPTAGQLKLASLEFTGAPPWPQKLSNRTISRNQILIPILCYMIGLVSDSHGLLRTEVLTELSGVEHIIHAGDVGDPQILQQLCAIAPVSAVRGNIDSNTDLPSNAIVESGGFRLYILHILDDLDLDPRGSGFGAVIYGHSHRPEAERREGVLYINPGSIGPRRFDLPVAMARIDTSQDILMFEHINLPRNQH